jgi:hypothetical protein
MSIRQRIADHAAVVKAAGLRGESMQKKLAEIVSQEDLPPPAIHRIAEQANREVLGEVMKTARAQKSDPRLKFELCDPAALVKEARKSAAASLFATSNHIEKLAAIDEAGGDPFAAPVQHEKDIGQIPLSLFHVPLDEKLAFALKEADVRSMLYQLDQHRLELEAMEKAACQASISIAGESQGAYDRAVQSAIDMVMTGVTLPSLYQAIMASTSGSKAPEEVEMEHRALLKMVVEGLKERGVPNHRLGFRYPARLGEIDKLGTDDIISMCEAAVAYSRGQNPAENLDKQLKLTKIAQKYLEVEPNYAAMKETGKHPYEDAAAWLQNRPSFKDHPLPQTYLDERNTGNLPRGGPRIVDGSSEFVTAIHDLVGARDRMLRQHAAKEFIGLKLQEIAQTAGQLKKAQVMAAEQFEKQSIAPLVAAAGRALAGAVIPAVAGKVVEGVTNPAPRTQAPDAVGAGV